MKIRLNTKAFTLVELIVVITILAVLASIAFISIWNVTWDARNAKRTNDLSSISTAIRQRVEINWMPISNAVSSVSSWTVMLSSAYIAWRIISDNDLEYMAWDVAYDQIQIKRSEFQDPNGIPYIIWATNLAGQVFELAASLELSWNKKSAYVVGTYVPRLWTWTSVQSNALSWIIDSYHFKITLQNDSDIGKFKIWDIITTKTWSQNAEITNISNDGRTITYDPVMANGSALFSSSTWAFLYSSNIQSIYLGYWNSWMWNTESAWLIKWSSDGPVIKDSQINLPYWWVTTTTACPAWFIQIPWNYEFSQGWFCIAKYEMKWTQASPSSIAAGLPIVNINQTQAIAACKNIWAHLITNNEWMTIARDIEQQPSNWSNNLVWSWWIYRWNNWLNDTLGCDGSDPEVAYADNTSLSSTRTTCADKRQLKLSNWQIIWDLAWNVWEHVNKANTLDWSGYNTTANKLFVWNPGGADAAWSELNSINNSYFIDNVLPKNTNLQKVNWIGWLWFYDWNIFLRGGGWSNASDAGLFALVLFWSSGDTHSNVGFRCAL